MADLTNFIEVTLIEQDDFLKVKETLTRIGVSSRKEKVLYQSCHILHKQGKYYITHFKELFALDGKPSNMTENDIQRRNSIAVLLEDWGLVKIVNKNIIGNNIAPIHQIKIISFKEKDDWELVPKYNIGKRSGG
jgi:alanine racemase